MPFISAACRMSKRSERPSTDACAGPENGPSAAIALSSVSWRDPPSAQAGQFSSVRCASLRTAAG